MGNPNYRKLLSFLILLFAHSSFGEEESRIERKSMGLRHFDGFQVYRINVDNKRQLKALGSLHDEGDLDFWTSPRKNGTTDVMASDSQRPQFDNFLKENNFTYEVMIDDVEKVVSQQRELRLKRKKVGMNWEEYQDWTTIEAWMDNMEKTYPKLVKVFKIGSSYEGKNIKVVKISKKSTSWLGNFGFQTERKRAMFFDGGFHAREWISPATLTYIMNELCENEPKYLKLLEKVDFYFLPVVNPDGYAFSHDLHRLWRKSRSDRGSLIGCKGVDLNRNFGYKWGGRGSSGNTCSEVYRGTEAFSEPEAKAIRDFILTFRDENGKKPDFKSYISIHSYGQFMFTPWGFSSEVPDDYPQLLRLADRSVNELYAVHGTWYLTGSSYNVLYAASGNSADWAKGAADIKYCYTMELRSRFIFGYGFLLPASSITPTAEETWAAFQVIAKHIAETDEFSKRG